MSEYETSTTVDGQGEIHLVGVPFQPGTEVEVAISAKKDGNGSTDARHRLGVLLSALDHAHNIVPIGPLNRDEFYDRGVLR